MNGYFTRLVNEWQAIASLVGILERPNGLHSFVFSLLDRRSCDSSGEGRGEEGCLSEGSTLELLLVDVRVFMVLKTRRCCNLVVG